MCFPTIVHWTKHVVSISSEGVGLTELEQSALEIPISIAINQLHPPTSSKRVVHEHYPCQQTDGQFSLFPSRVAESK
jgi:hypothetical protein